MILLEDERLILLYLYTTKFVLSFFSTGFEKNDYLLERKMENDNRECSSKNHIWKGKQL